MESFPIFLGVFTDPPNHYIYFQKKLGGFRHCKIEMRYMSDVQRRRKIIPGHLQICALERS